MADWPADRVMLFAGLDADFIGGALHRDALIGPDLLGIGVRTQAQWPLAVMALMPPACVYRLVVWPLTLLRGVACGQLHIALHRHAGVLAAEQADGGWRDECGCDRRIKVHQGFGKLFYGVGQGATLGF